MKKILPIILIVLGIIEITIAFMGVKMPLLIAIVMGVMFILFGVRELLNTSKKN
ncbi:MAG: hypothetical protein NC086_06195 [Alistipes sp.]|nr:hypothetical protein [Alistipes sp.]